MKIGSKFVWATASGEAYIAVANMGRYFISLYYQLRCTFLVIRRKLIDHFFLERAINSKFGIRTTYSCPPSKQLSVEGINARTWAALDKWEGRGTLFPRGTILLATSRIPPRNSLGWALKGSSRGFNHLTPPPISAASPLRGFRADRLTSYLLLRPSIMYLHQAKMYHK